MYIDTDGKIVSTDKGFFLKVKSGQGWHFVP